MNLALGVPAMVPLDLAWWLLTEYLPMSCRSMKDVGRPGHADCEYTTLDYAGPAMFMLSVTGLLMLVLILTVDVVVPLRRGDRLGRWLGSAALILAPFTVCAALD
ncbi:hypothetical protein [Streptomyces sp. NPDC088746]|uniref:hypothetical protein n=1 Tax=Streptomyces sp. NPDC088746 TaxID=3365885 RepID=UPI0037FE77E5